MNTMRRMTHFNRSDKNLPLTIATNAIPPRELFLGHKTVLEEYDKLVNLLGSEKENNRLAARKLADAKVADAEYQASVRKAMESGKDSSKVKSTAEQLRAESKVHSEHAAQAKGRAERQAEVLGEAIKAIALDLFAASEEEMVSAGAELASLTEELDAVWSKWGSAWAARLWLSMAHHKGGRQAWHGEKIPAEVREALTVVASAPAYLDVLKHDETQLGEWRYRNGPDRTATAKATLAKWYEDNPDQERWRHLA